MNGPEAIILNDSQPDSVTRTVRLTEFFGVPSRSVRIGDFWNSAAKQARVFGTAEAFCELLGELGRDPERLRQWTEQVHSVFIHAGADTAHLKSLVATLGGLRIGNGATREFGITSQWDPFCGIMAGVKCTLNQPFEGPILNTEEIKSLTLITCPEGSIFVKTMVHGVPVFITTAKELIDLSARLTKQNFDVRDHWLAAVPVVMYLKWAFAGYCWAAPEINACLVIDDPLLRPDYGYVNYESFLAWMKQHRFSTNIAFIPWNYARSHSSVVRLFREHPDKFSLSVHGCDHTGSEFGHQEKDWLAGRSREALTRMEQHAARTKIAHERVMVFPQGVFSAPAPGVLKQSGYLAVVNSDVLTTDPVPLPVTIGSYWDAAVMDYDCFPIYTRRYPTEGTANFAFDILLGKPCIMLIHHEYCWDGGKALLAAIDELNALYGRLNWCNLGEVVRRGFRQRNLPDGRVAVEMYGSEVQLKNATSQKLKYVIHKRENAPALIQEIRVGKAVATWQTEAGRVIFEVELGPGESCLAEIRFRSYDLSRQEAENWLSQGKIRLRRYLCEVRDNYVTKWRFALRPPVAK